jgi:hypothetical protein
VESWRPQTLANGRVFSPHSNGLLNFRSNGLQVVSPFTRLKVPIKKYVKVFLSKFFDRVNLNQKLCQRTLMDFDGIETHSYFSKNFDELWWELTNQTIFSEARFIVCLWIYRQKVTWDRNFDQSLTKFWSCKRDTFLWAKIPSKIWPNFWWKTLIV